MTFLRSATSFDKSSPGAESIRAVLFDVDGTLYAQLPLRAAMACELMLAQVKPTRAGQPSAIRIVRAFRELREELRRADGTVVVEREQYLGVSRRLHCSEQAVKSAVAEWIHDRPLKYLRLVRRPGLVQLLDALRSRGVRCGVFSDYPAERKLAALGLRDKFDFVFSADDPHIGAFKPNPRGFLRACERWGLRPSQVMYVGDRPEVDAAGATAAGMPCALIGRRTAQMDRGWLIKDFQELQRVICADS